MGRRGGRLPCDLGSITLGGAETLCSKDTSASAGQEGFSSFWNKVGVGGFDLIWGGEMVRGTTDCGKQADPMGGGAGGQQLQRPEGDDKLWATGSQDSGSWTPTFL